MEVRVRVPAQLRELVAGVAIVTVDVPEAGDGRHVTVGDVLDVLRACHPALERRIRDERGEGRTHVNLFVGADNVRDRDGPRTPITAGQELTIIPAVSGG
jgi:sulfur-carrier protein